MQYKRKELQTKKDFYRRLGQIRKNNWASHHKNLDDQNIKSHFMVNDDSSVSDETKTKKILKGELRTEQRLRNRVAAQESRERHRSYVQQLEKKVKMYEEMLDQQGALCKNCRKNLLSETNYSQMMVQEISEQNVSANLLESKITEEQILNSYLDDRMIRIDNNGATTPFGVFFVICLVAVLAIFYLSPGASDINPRLLANYQSTVKQLISIQDTKFQENKFEEHVLKLMEISMMQGKDQMNTLDYEISSRYVAPAIELRHDSNRNWTKYGDYICSEPSIIQKSRSAKSKNEPEFLLLRTGRNASAKLKKLKVTSDEKEGHRINIQSNEWVQISSCFRGDL